MRDGILLLDSTGRILLANQALKEILSSTDGQISVGKNINDISPDSDIGNVIADALTNPEEREVELELADKGTAISISATPINDGGATNLLIIFKNITKQRELDNIRRDFVANVSHDLKTPITGIKLLADAIRQTADTEAIKNFAERLEKETSRLMQLVNDLLDLSKLETVDPKFGYFDLASLLEELATEFKSAAETKGIVLRVNIAERLPQYFGNPEQIELMVVNLLDNAVRYTATGGKINLKLSHRDKNFQFVIADTGIGIPKKDIGRIFERFYRVDKARSRKKGGTGLGLSIVKHVVQNHGGGIMVESRVGVGSKFIVNLPTP